jgi:hypothetical protein
MVRSLLLVGLLATSAASAQSITLKWTRQDADTIRFNASACNAQESVTWTNTATTLNLCLNTPLKLWSTELECTDNPSATDVQYDSVDSLELAMQTGTFQVPLAGLPGFKYGDAGVTCGQLDITKNHKICGSYQVNAATLGGACTIQQAKSLTLVYDTAPPGVPSIDEVSEQDGALLIKFTASTDSAVVHFDTRAQGTDLFVEKGSLATTAGSSIRISNLVNGTTYDLRARAEDAAGNFSEPSELVAATPRLTKGFWATYRDAGGSEKGGCQAVHGFPLLLAGGLWLMRRKRNR